MFLGTGAGSFIDLAAAAAAGIKVSTIKGYGDTAVAEHTLGLVFAAARNIATMHKIMRDGGWQVMQGIELKGKTLGLIGLGGIGREIARLGKGIGLDVIAFNRSAIEDAPVPLVALEALLGRADVVSLHLALNDGTRHFLDPQPPGDDAARRHSGEHGACRGGGRGGARRPLARRPYRALRHRRLCRGAPASQRAPAAARAGDAHRRIAAYNTPEAAMTMYRRAIDLAAAG